MPPEAEENGTHAQEVIESARICGGAELSRWSVCSEKLRKVVTGGVSERVVAKREKFVFNSRADWKPVELSEKRLYVVLFPSFQN